MEFYISLNICFLEFKREKFYPGPGLEPGLLAFRANALTQASAIMYSMLPQDDVAQRNLQYT